ncbi:hypothetical protein Tco_0728401 [Tanacetum coccineum]|uniref:Uncharacterized protein n=1 Tax=Tanacetum coccineum TaxID=301880 RepID=A0ABQ4YNF8_9ASTR
MIRNDKLRVRARCFGKIPVFTTAAHGCENDYNVGHRKSKGPITMKRKRKTLGIEGDSQASVSASGEIHDIGNSRPTLKRIGISNLKCKAFRAKSKADMEIKGDHTLEYECHTPPRRKREA